MSWRFITCAALFVTCLLTANVIAAKLIVVAGVVLTAGIVIFPLSYVLGDVLTEVWGYGAARRVIWLGFACNAVMVLAIWLGGELPAAPFGASQYAYDEVRGLWVRTIGSTVVGQALDSAVFVTLAFAGSMPGPALAGVVVGQWIFKVAY